MSWADPQGCAARRAPQPLQNRRGHLFSDGFVVSRQKGLRGGTGILSLPDRARLHFPHGQMKSPVCGNLGGNLEQGTRLLRLLRSGRGHADRENSAIERYTGCIYQLCQRDCSLSLGEKRRELKCIGQTMEIRRFKCGVDCSAYPGF